VDPLYGRGAFIDQAQAAVERALAGAGRTLLFTGEPGIGKSALAEHVAAAAAARLAAVAWGRCWEAGGAPPYWPWLQIFRGLGMDEDPFAGGVAAVGPGAADARFAAFDRAVLALQARAAQTPLALILDDLHAADAPSLLLLLLLTRQLRGSRILVVGAYREAEARLSPEVPPLLAKIAREADVLPLPRLGPQDVAAWVEASGGGAGVATEIFRLTEGHPLFVVEALRLGPRGAAPEWLPAGLGAVLDEHLGRLSPRTRAVLEIAAVLGRDFATADVAATGGTGLDLVHEALGEAAATSVVQPTGELGRFRFAHVLLRDRIYAEIVPSERARLHLSAATVTLAHGPSAVGAAVHHLFEGQSAGSPQRVAEVALAAAGDSLSRLAFEDAARVARRALSLPGEGALPPSLEGRLCVTLAEASIRLGEASEGKALCVQAAASAEAAGDPELLARAALVYSTELASGIIDPQMNTLLRRALAALGEGDSPVRARLLARLAAGLTPPQDPESGSEILALMRSATGMARRLGDRHTLLYVLQFAATVGLLVPEDERFSFMQETVHLATALDQGLVLLHTLPAYMTALLARGQPAEAEAVFPRYDELLAESRQPLYRVHRAVVRALFCTIRGDFDEAERLGAEARAIAERAGSDAGLRTWVTHRLSVAFLRGQPELLAGDAAPLVFQHEFMWGGGSFMAWTLIGLGRSQEAVERVRKVELAARSIPSANLMDLMGAADVCVRLGDVELGKAVYPRLLRAVDRMFWNLAPGAVLGPTARTLGDLALLIGLPREAAGHYEEAVAFCERLGAAPLVEQCRHARDQALSRGAGPAMASARPAAKAPTAPVTLRREGDVWAVNGAAGATIRLKNAKGFGYLHYLLEQPGRQVHVLELVGIDQPVGDAGPLLDARAKQEYRRRLDDLRDQLAEAEAFGDAARAARIEAEIGGIAEQLAGAVGLGGRDRRAASAVERTRINVQRCLKDAIERIAALDPALGRYLAATVKSGTYCAYHPL